MIDPELARLVLEIASTPAARFDIGATMADVCATLPATLGLQSCVAVLIVSPDGPSFAVFASDRDARRLGELQVREANGPLLNSIRTGRLLVTPDLSRIGPPVVAAAADDSGLVSSVTLPLAADGPVLGGLQLLGVIGGQPATAEHAELARPLLEVLAAKMADAGAHRERSASLAQPQSASGVDARVEQARGMLAERFHTDLDQALHILRTQADAARVTIAEAAAAIVRRDDHRPAAPMPRREHPPASRVAPPSQRQPPPAARHRRG